MAEQMLQCLDNGSPLWSGFAFLKFLNSFPVTLDLVLIFTSLALAAMNNGMPLFMSYSLLK